MFQCILRLTTLPQPFPPVKPDSLIPDLSPVSGADPFSYKKQYDLNPAIAKFAEGARLRTRRRTVVLQVFANKADSVKSKCKI